MQQLSLTADQAALIDESAAAPAPTPKVDDPEVLMTMPLTEAKRLAAAEFERRYLIRVMERAGGSVSEGARLSGLDRTNFRRLLQRHSLKERSAKGTAEQTVVKVDAPAVKTAPSLTVGQRVAYDSPRGIVHGKVLLLYRYRPCVHFAPDSGPRIDVSLDKLEAI